MKDRDTIRAVPVGIIRAVPAVTTVRGDIIPAVTTAPGDIIREVPAVTTAPGDIIREAPALSLVPEGIIPAAVIQWDRTAWDLVA